ncbi:MAG: hypothetical protein ACR2QA_09200 [Solirubrobacteraceae bacterium]
MTTETPLANWASEGYDGPQPWDHQALGITAEQRDSLDPGAENTVTPTVTHSYPILSSGSAHPVVHELGRKLAKLGYTNSVSRGENPFGHVDQSVMTAIDAFRSHYGVQEDPSGFGGNTPAGRQLAAAHVGPWTIEAILHAHDQAQAQE